MSVRRERGISSEPEVVFNVATDPARVGWLPEPLHHRPAATAPGLFATWRDDAGGWRADLVVEDIPSGGALAVLEMSADGLDDAALTAVVEHALTELDGEVEENFTGG
ncbi:hypothetical protein Ais01nite_50250 [Asanoa ishikariensis]|uniref:Uncharacterized protein n=1 Tax=Asanoa ishikariensis TaxID=137265 RepID=A0A1H3RP33_9ACTN|nr:hypothetical protein [Asanoa ishikariensis]GIF66990.1 hypothetical protein Ais01nite_50250 [Asanoa ishikariensis]SDZ27482.1 hypothetical protein SAMN05421684_4056 [Asanoa ishikariensis]